MTPAGKQRRYWSQEVMRKSNALDLEPGVFTWSDPKRIAQSLKRSAELSVRRKGTSLQSAMSMLSFYINRAGTNLDTAQRRVLEEAKHELRGLYDGR
jgi:putative cell wall-binding protein